MIPYNRILSEMERQLLVAQSATDEQQMREALSAVKSLCEVALGEQDRAKKKIFQKRSITEPVGQSLTSLEGRPLEEEDANGGSIFDF